MASMLGRTSRIRLTLAVYVAMDGTNLPFFNIFKGIPGESVDHKLTLLLPARIVGSIQTNAWMDDRSVDIWDNKMYKTFIAGYTGNYGLLLDEFICHKSDKLKRIMDDANKMSDMILLPIRIQYLILSHRIFVRTQRSFKNYLRLSEMG